MKKHDNIKEEWKQKKAVKSQNSVEQKCE
jgi:hypothetical protein